MFELQTVVLIGIGYLSLLFFIGALGEKLKGNWTDKLRPFLLALAATYTSAWMFFGTPAQAVENAWIIPPTFLGAIIALVAGATILKRIVTISHERRSNNIADFISSLYNSQYLLSVVVTVVAVIAILPYLSLQLRAITESISLISDVETNDIPWLSLSVTLVLAVFASIFGAAHVDSSRSRNGMLLAVGVDAIIKICAFLAIAYFALFSIQSGPMELIEKASAKMSTLETLDEGGYLATLLFGSLAVLCLPRQFHLLAVETKSPSDLSVIRSLTPVYLGLLCFAAPAIGFGGLVMLGDTIPKAEQYVIGLPLMAGNEPLTLFAFIGGFSAGASMLLIASIALSNLVNNTLITPLWVRRIKHRPQAGTLGKTLQRSRRITILLVMAIALGLEQFMSPDLRLGTFGVLSLALVAQLAPPVLVKVFWTKATTTGAVLGLAAGLALTGLSAISNYTLGTDFIAQALSLEWHSFSIACVFGLGGNFLVIFVVSKLFQPTTNRSTKKTTDTLDYISLYQLVSGFVGEKTARSILGSPTEQRVNSQALLSARQLLAGIVGSNTADRLLSGSERHHESFQSLWTAQDIYHIGQDRLQNSIDNIDQGISVVDKNLNLVAWNKAYLKLYDYPHDMIHVGKPVRALIEYNAKRGLCGPGSATELVEKRIKHLENRTAYKFTRKRSDGRVIDIVGRPLPDGGFVTTFTDISEFASTLDELELIKENLEQTVALRTDELVDTNGKLEEAMTSKTRFLAAASHDLVQPLNASKLFLEAISIDQLDSENQMLLERTQDSLKNAEQLITDMLQIARLDSGDLQPRPEAIDLFPLVDSVVAGLQQELSSRDLEELAIRIRPFNVTVMADRGFLRRIVQNLVENAVKFTDTGEVLVACRIRGDECSLEVWDTGVGINPDYLNQMFVEFTRGENPNTHGYGLGLSTVKKLCDAQQFPVTVRSNVGRGTVFKVRLPITLTQSQAVETEETVSEHCSRLDIMVVDNEEQVLDAVDAILRKWGYHVIRYDGRSELDVTNVPDVILMDYHLDHGKTGVELYREFSHIWGDLPIAFLSAESAEVISSEMGCSVPILTKPIRAAKLRALLRSFEQTTTNVG